MINTDALRRIFRSDALSPGTAVFPNIDERLIASDLKLAETGRDRGEQNRPSGDALSLDGAEMSAIAEIEKLRRTGLENYEQNKRIYTDRLGRADEARREVTSGADRARGDFVATVHIEQSQLVDAQRRVTDAYNYLLRFRESHDLVRPSEPSRPLSLFALILFFLLVEGLLNAQLLGAAHEMGLLGGMLLAIVIAVANIAVSGIAGWQVRSINRASILGKIRGLLTLAGFVGFAIVFNLIVGHLRDALDDATTIDVAARTAFSTFLRIPNGVQSAMSWLLVLIGLVVSVGTAFKAYHSFDPYPDYAKVEEIVSDARARYNEELRAAIEELTEKRDSAIDALNEGRDLINAGIREGVDAAQGQSALKAHLNSFLEQCNLKANQLLTIYRDSNRDARSEPAPDHFDREYRFEDYREPGVGSAAVRNAEKERREIGKIVDAAIAAIGIQYDAAILSFPRVGDLEERTPETAGSRRANEAAMAVATNRQTDALEEVSDRPTVVSATAEKH